MDLRRFALPAQARCTSAICAEPRAARRNLMPSVPDHARPGRVRDERPEKDGRRNSVTEHRLMLRSPRFTHRKIRDLTGSLHTVDFPPCSVVTRDQRFHRRLPFRGHVRGLRQLDNVVAGVSQGDDLAAAGQRNRIVKQPLPPRSTNGAPFRFPVRWHALVSFEATIFLGSPVPLIAPGLKIRFGSLRQKSRPCGFEVVAHRSKVAAVPTVHSPG